MWKDDITKDFRKYLAPRKKEDRYWEYKELVPDAPPEAVTAFNEYLKIMKELEEKGIIV